MRGNAGRIGPVSGWVVETGGAYNRGMNSRFDDDTLDRLRRMEPDEAFEAAKDAVYRTGAVSSDDFLDAFEALVEAGVLTREQLDQLMGASR